MTSHTALHPGFNDRARHLTDTVLGGRCEIDANARRALSQDYNIDPEQAAADLMRGLDGHASIVISANSSRGKVNYIEFKLNAPGVSFHRLFYPDINTVVHHSAKVSQMGSGTGSMIYANFLNLYRKLGVKHIDMVASDIGNYAWARCGFYPDEKSWRAMRRGLTERLSYLEDNPPPEGPLPKEAIKAVRAALSQETGQSYWQIFDQAAPCHGTTLGKALSLHVDGMPRNTLVSWTGRFDLDSVECLSRQNESHARSVGRSSAITRSPPQNK